MLSTSRLTENAWAALQTRTRSPTGRAIVGLSTVSRDVLASDELSSATLLQAGKHATHAKADPIVRRRIGRFI